MVLNIAARYWNEIAECGLTSAFGAAYFLLDQDQLTVAMQELADDLEGRGIHWEVVSAYLDFGPLIAEHEAILEYARQNPQVRTAIPEINTIKEAVYAASRERYLDPIQQFKLTCLLEDLPIANHLWWTEDQMRQMTCENIGPVAEVMKPPRQTKVRRLIRVAKLYRLLKNETAARQKPKLEP